MAEYIEREALRDSVESIDWYSVHRGKITTGAKSSENALYKANDIYSAIDNVPSSDVAPVRHGLWLEVREKRLFGEHYFLCSNCKSRNGLMITFNYCPNCGAKMDGDG